MYYAQTTNNVVTSVTEVHSPLPPADNLIEISAFDAALIGHTYDPATGVFSPPEPVYDERVWWIDIGPFFDRFGQHKYAILADTSPVVQALIKDSSVRKYIDLKRVDLPAGLAMLVNAGHAIDVQAILTTPTAEAERHVKGLLA